MSLFEPYQVSADAVREAAEQSTAGIDELQQLRADVDVEHRAAVGAVEGDIRPYVETAPDASGKHSQAIIAKLSFARGGAHMFAIAIDNFNTDSSDPRSVSKLNAAYEEAAANHFGVDAGEYTKDEGGLPTLDKSRYSGAVTTAKNALVADLKAEYVRLDKQLDEAAAEVAAMLKGKDPSDADVRAMFEAGALPSYAALLFPNVDFSGLKVVRLPTDLRGKPNEEIAEYVLGLEPEMAALIAQSLPPEAQRAVAGVLATRLKDLDLRSVEGLPAAQKVSGLLEAFRDKAIGSYVVEQLGADGMASVLADLAIPYADRGAWSDEHAEVLRKLQDSVGASLAGMLAYATRRGLPSDYGRELVKRSRLATYVLFSYGDKQRAVFDGAFLVAAGNAMRDNGAHVEGFSYPEQTRAWTFGSDLTLDNSSAMDALLAVADNHDESAQAVMGDRALATDLLTGNAGTSGNEQTAKVLRLATIDQAAAYDPARDEPSSADFWKALKAAEISSMVLDIAGEGNEASDQFDDEIAGILSTYIADVDRAYAIGDAHAPGVYDHTSEGWDSHIAITDGFPPFGIKISSADLRDVLEDIGDDENARKLVAQAATAYDQLRIDRNVEAMAEWKAEGSDGVSPLEAGARANAQLRGYLVDALGDGLHKSAQSEADARREVAKLFTLPVDLLPVGKAMGEAGPFGSLITGWVKDQIAKGIVGDGVAVATEQVNNDWDESRQRLLVQTYDAMRSETQRHLDDPTDPEHVGLLSEDELEEWPTDANGDLKPFGALTQSEQTKLLHMFQGNWGQSGAAEAAVEGSYDNYVKHQK